MTPKKTIFDRGAVLRAALDIIRRHGWDALTARAVAGRLGRRSRPSTAPSGRWRASPGSPDGDPASPRGVHGQELL